MMADQPRMQADKMLKVRQMPPNDKQVTENLKNLKAKAEVAVQNLKRCGYKPIECTHLTLEGYDYCLRHILSDKNAPYKQCAFIYSANGKRCHLPCPRDKKDPGYCNEHALKTQLQNWKRNSHNQPPRTAEVLLHSLVHYIHKPKAHTSSTNEDSIIIDDVDSKTTKSLNPFTDINVNGILSSGSQILDMCSESESDVDATSFGSIWHDIQAESSDNDSIDSEQEDVLKHARLYTAEEICLITRDKLMRLQNLYSEQYRYLHHSLRERRRRYLHAVKREKESHCNIANQMHESTKERRLYKKLKAYNSYHKRHGTDAICNKRLNERRLKITEGVIPKTHMFTKCVYTEGGVKCGSRALPVTRHCRKHILEDTNQILFRACGKIQNEIECQTPVEGIFDNTTCRLHTDIPEIRSYANARKESESDYDESLDAPTRTEPSIKNELEEPKRSIADDENMISTTSIFGDGNLVKDLGIVEPMDITQESSFKREPQPEIPEEQQVVKEETL